MARKDEWTTISVRKTQFDILEQIHKKTRLNKYDIIEFALMEKYPDFFPEEAIKL